MSHKIIVIDDEKLIRWTLEQHLVKEGYEVVTADSAEKGYELWSGTLSPVRPPQDLRWDVAYTMAVYRFPRGLVHKLLDSPLFARRVHLAAGFMRKLRSAAALKARIRYKVTGDFPFPSAS